MYRVLLVRFGLLAERLFPQVEVTRRGRLRVLPTGDGGAAMQFEFILTSCGILHQFWRNTAEKSGEARHGQKVLHAGTTRTRLKMTMAYAIAPTALDDQ